MRDVVDPSPPSARHAPQRRQCAEAVRRREIHRARDAVAARIGDHPFERAAHAKRVVVWCVESRSDIVPAPLRAACLKAIAKQRRRGTRPRRSQRS